MQKKIGVNHTERWLLIGVVLIALVLRIPLLSGSFWLDEAAQALESTRPLTQQFDIAYDFQPPLFHLIVHVFTYFSTQEWWLRLASLIPGILTVYFTFQIGKRLASNWVGLLAALLLATHSFHIFYSQELRPYALPALLAVWSWWVLIQIVGKVSSTSGKQSVAFPEIKQFAVFTILTVAGLYSSYLYPFLVLSQFFSVAAFKRTWLTKFTASFTVSALCFLPWIPMFLQQLRVGSTLRQNTLGWDQVVSIPQLKAVPLTMGKFLFGVIELDAKVGLVVAGVAIAGLLCAVVFHWLRAQKFQPKKLLNDQTMVILTSWGVLPLLIAWLISFAVPVVQPKRVLYLLPALCLGLSDLIVKQWKRPVAKLLLIGLLMVNGFGTLQYFTQAKLQRENWRGLITQIDAQFSQTDTIIVFKFDEPFAPWMWYDHQAFPVVKTGTSTIQADTQLEPLMKRVLLYDTVVVWDYLSDLTDPDKRVEAWLTQYGYAQYELFEAPGIGFVRVYRRGKVVGIRVQ